MLKTYLAILAAVCVQAYTPTLYSASKNNTCSEHTCSDTDLGVTAYRAKQYSEAKELFTSSCAENDGKGCFGIGLGYYEGNWGQMDRTVARTDFFKA